MYKLIGKLDYIVDGRNIINFITDAKDMARAFDAYNDKFMCYDKTAHKWVSMPANWQYLERIFRDYDALAESGFTGLVGVLYDNAIWVTVDGKPVTQYAGFVPDIEAGDIFVCNNIIQKVNEPKVSGVLEYTPQGWCIQTPAAELDNVIKQHVAVLTEELQDRIHNLEVEVKILREGDNL